MAFYPENIPQQLKALCQWGCYELEEVSGQRTKVPYNPSTNQRASSTDPQSWVSFGTAQAAYSDLELYDGICFFLTEESDLVLIDLDNSISDDGSIIPWAMGIVKQFASYTEISQSGKGLHILITGSKPGNRCNTAKYPHKVEIYDHARQCCLTGNVLEGRSTIESRQEQLNELYGAIFVRELEQRQNPATVPYPAYSRLSDETVIAAMLGSAKADEIEALLGGDISAYGGDDSAADLALCNHLAFFTGKDMTQMDRIFRKSKLLRPKWDERRGQQTYGKLTIEKACDGTSDTYTPPKADTEVEITEEEFKAFKLPGGPKFSISLPADHFITRFMGYGTAISDAYRVYWFMAALFILGVVVDKKLMFKTSMATFYLNVWIYILGDSSLARKTTAVQKAYDMLKAVLGDRFVNACIPNTFSPEAFTEHMDAYNHAAWIRDEAAGVLSVMQKDYMRGFKDDLMQLYDCHPITRMLRTKRSGEKTRFNVNDPYLNLFFASTGAALGYNLDLIDKETGFLARFVFAYPQDEKENYMPLDKGAALHSELEEICISQLTAIAALIDAIPTCIDMTHSPDARAYYNKWQETRDKEAAALKDGYSSQIFSRLNPFVMKMAMAFEVGSSDFDPTRPIREEYFVECCRLVDEYFMPTIRAVYDIIGTANKDNQIEKIVLYLTRHGGKATRKEIMRDVKIKSKEMTDYLLTMVECEMIVLC